MGSLIWLCALGDFAEVGLRVVGIDVAVAAILFGKNENAEPLHHFLERDQHLLNHAQNVVDRDVENRTAHELHLTFKYRYFFIIIVSQPLVQNKSQN